MSLVVLTADARAFALSTAGSRDRHFDILFEDWLILEGLRSEELGGVACLRSNEKRVEGGGSVYIGSSNGCFSLVRENDLNQANDDWSTTNASSQA